MMMRKYTIQIRNDKAHDRYETVSDDLSATEAKAAWEDLTLVEPWRARLLEFDGYITRTIARKGGQS